MEAKINLTEQQLNDLSNHIEMLFEMKLIDLQTYIGIMKPVNDELIRINKNENK